MINCVNDKIKVFVSSRCGTPKYDNIRSKLKRSLEDTGFIKVYLFEEGIASTMTAQQDYLYFLDDSDVCIFLVDNEDGVTPAILKEIKRAKDYPKKSLYLFSSESSLEASQVQKDLYGADGCRFLNVDKFERLADAGFESLINDITRIYQSYCKDRIVDNEFDDNGVDDEYVQEDGSNDIPYKQLLSLLDKCNIFFRKRLNLYFKEEVENTSELDNHLANFLEVIFDGKSINDFNAFLFLEETKGYHNDDFHDVVVRRWGAIQKYWKGNLVECYDELEVALYKAKEHNLPEWFVQDLLIDLRNLRIYIDNSRNSVSLDNEIQKELSSQQRHVYYPVLDRYEKNLYESIESEREKYIKRSPHSKVIGNSFSGYIDNVVNIYCIAAMNGSLTHLELIPRRLKNILFNICVEYEDIPYIRELLKMTLYTGTFKDIKDYARTFNGIYSKTSNNDVEDLYDFCKTIPLEYKRQIAELNVIKVFGYYASDDFYNDIIIQKYEEIHEWIRDENKLVILGDHYIDTLKNNRHRTDDVKVLEICLEILEKGFYRFADKVMELLVYVDYDKVKEDQVVRLINLICLFYEDIEIHSKLHKLGSLVIALRNNYADLFIQFDDIVLKSKPDFYNGMYKLETKLDKEISEEFISKRIEQIRKRNVEQGNNGTIIGYGENPYKTIRNIYENRELIDDGLILDIYEVSYETVISAWQTYYDKLNALELMLYMKNKINDSKQIISFYDKQFKENVNSIFMSCDTLFGDDSDSAIRFGLTFINSIATGNGEMEFLQLVANLGDYSDKEKIDILNMIECMYMNHRNISNRKLYSLVQMFVIGLIKDEDHDVRYNAYVTLIAMLDEESSELTLNVLSKKFDEESSYIKFLILENYERLISLNEEISHMILEKAIIDSNYVVREKATSLKS